MVEWSQIFDKINSLISWNGILSLIYLLLIIFVSINYKTLEGNIPQDSPLNLSTYYHVIEYDTEPHNVESVLYKHITVRQIKITLIIILSISAIIHFISALNIGCKYSCVMSQKNNSFRWIDLGISYPIMVLMISLFAGVKDISNFYLIGLISASIILLLAYVEDMYLNHGPDEKFCSYSQAILNSKYFVPVALLILLFFGTWLIIGTELYQRVIDLEQSKGEVFPRWIIVLTIGMFLLHLIFGMIIIRLYIDNYNYIAIDKIYMLINLFSKVLLVFTIYYGFQLYTVT